MILTFLLVNICVSFKAQQNEWECPTIYERNKEKPHADFGIYESAVDAKSENIESSPWYKSLNGKWKFDYAPSIEKAIGNFIAQTYRMRTGMKSMFLQIGNWKVLESL